MKIAVLGDAHLISPKATEEKKVKKRKHFRGTEVSFRKMMNKVEKKKPDLVVFLGDLVDWFSKENISYAVNLVNEFEIPREAVPGNHDINGSISKNRMLQEWERQGINFENRIIEKKDLALIFLDSALSRVPEGTAKWLDQNIDKTKKNILFSHVPLDIPEVREFILNVDPDKDLNKYVQSKSPNLYDDCLKGNIDQVYTGHLHFGGELRIENTEMYFMPVCVKAGKPYPDMGKVLIFDTETDEHKYLEI